MDFIEDLSPFRGNRLIFVIAYFLLLPHPYTALNVPPLILDNMFKLHGMSGSITSDRNPIILSQFWTEFFTLQGVPLIKTTTYHRQSNGQTKTANKGLKTYLCGMCSKNCTLSIIQTFTLQSSPHHLRSFMGNHL